MKQEIFAKILPNKTSVHVYRDASDDTTTWEVSVSKDEEKTSRFFSVRNEDMVERAAQGRPEKFMERLKAYDALPDPAMKALLLVVDKFGSVDVMRYRLGAGDLFDASNVEVLPLRSYKLVPRDVQLLGETVEDVTTYEHHLMAISKSLYRYYDSYFLSILDLDKKTSAEYRLSTTELSNASPEIDDESIQSLAGVPLNAPGITRVLEAVQKKSAVGNGKLQYKFALLSGGFKKSLLEGTKLHSDALFFVDIGGAPMIMFYTNLNEWYIAPESLLKPEATGAPHDIYGDLFIYK